jgi:hypothetical protein
MGEMDSHLEMKPQKLSHVSWILLYPKEVQMAINKALFDENWKEIRSQSATRWSLMAEHDLIKVDKAEIKLDKFATMLQVKYGFTRQQARDEINRLWAEHVARSKLLAA